MRIGFVDVTAVQYSAATPYESPLGGSQSAVCYLASELAGLGHGVTIFNAGQTTGEILGVRSENFREATSATGRLRELDAVVVVSASIGRVLRREEEIGGPLVLWTHHAHDQLPIRPLSSGRERKSWTAFAFLSDWQRSNYERAFWMEPGKGVIKRNAVSPAFLETPESRPWFETGAAPVLAYTSTPFRGLDVLLDAFPAIRDAIPGTRLRIYSSMQVYQERDEFGWLYERARSIDGVEYVGSLSQRRLAVEMSGVAALAYPSTFAETSCISMIEAMVAGAAVFSTDLGALRETSGGHASLIPFVVDKGKLAETFAEMVIAGLSDMRERPDEAAAKRADRAAYVRENYTWPQRAREWSDWLAAL